MKKKIIVVILFLLLIFLSYKLFSWYNTIYYAEKFWGVPVPYHAKLLKNESDWEVIGNSGYTKMVFDVSNADKDILKTAGFKKSHENKIVYKYPDPTGYSQVIIRNETMDENLDLSHCYYYDKELKVGSVKLVVYNPRQKKMYFFYGKMPYFIKTGKM